LFSYVRGHRQRYEASYSQDALRITGVPSASLHMCCTCMYMYVHMSTVCLGLYTCWCTYVCTFFVQIYTRMHARRHELTCVYMHRHTDICTYTFLLYVMYICVRIHACEHVHM
jgi:hypothetical protein